MAIVFYIREKGLPALKAAIPFQSRGPKCRSLYMPKTCDKQVGALSLASVSAEADIPQNQIGLPLKNVG